MTEKGYYAKGVAKREEILGAALQIIGEQGYRAASVRTIADAVGLSPAGLLHYFGTKEDLFVAILEARDRADTSKLVTDDFIEGFMKTMDHNKDVPGLVRLYSQLAVEAGDEGHPAHEFFTKRTAAVRIAARKTLLEMRERGTLRKDLDLDWVMLISHAAADGLQTAWLLDPTIDLVEPMRKLFEVLGDPICEDK